MTPRNSTSDEALDLLPHLSLSRWICRRLREPSGSQPATTKQDTPSSVRASVRNTSECGTEKNHLCPTRCHPNFSSQLSGSGASRIRLAFPSSPCRPSRPVFALLEGDV